MEPDGEELELKELRKRAESDPNEKAELFWL